MNDKAYGWDLETIINCFTGCFVHIGTKKKLTIECSVRKNELAFLVNFLTQKHKPILVGYNCLNFDSPIAKYIVEHVNELSVMPGDKAAYEIYKVAQQTILEERKVRWSSLDVPELDLFLLHHFDNEAKYTSLKWIQCHLGWDNIMEMPYPHDVPIDPVNIDKVLEYNYNDVMSTIALAQHNRTSELLEIRKWASSEFTNTALYNYSNSSMGEYMLMERLGDREGSFPSMKYDFTLRNIILPAIEFKSRQFNDVLRRLSTVQIADYLAAPKIKVTTNFDGMLYDFALGGLHGARQNSLHEDVVTIDAVSYYPNISIQFKLAPRHLGENFIVPYSEMFEMRKKTPKGSVQNIAWKESLNSAFGKSNSEYSRLFDPMFTFSITINGQLLLAMLAERITLEGAGKIIMINTDGMELICHDREKLDDIMTWWQKMTKITLEESLYEKILIRDVNNYIAVKKGGSLKMKGAYEINKELHKDPSMKVVPTIVAGLFLKDRVVVPKREVIERLKQAAKEDYTQFFMYQRAKVGELIGYTHHAHEVSFQKTLRYLIIKNGKNGFILSRRSPSGESKIHKDVWIVPMNDLDDVEISREEIINSIDYEWYAEEVMKLISFGVPASVPLFT